MKLTQAQVPGSHVVAFDRPPFGLSQRPTKLEEGKTNPYSSQGAIELAKGLLQGLGITSAVHVGHSAGASLAVRFALRYVGQFSSGIIPFISFPVYSISKSHVLMT